MTWWIYMIRAKNGKIYTGIAKDVEARFIKHCEGKGAKFFRSTSPVAIVYRESCEDKGQALRRENSIKKFTKQQKETLIRDFALAPDNPLSSTGPQPR